ncbi:outer membrane biosynthesis protein TonB [Pseudoclavibacter chungangensis]|uniref:hypothetical protein n=1 Tax=Pseudoclavibacter chungangensis TaxID=587635 RepID=UPI0015CC527A|nr:hypothetical protein [Pseudoclavibacter chungangensis]NYJ68201.1 outer membrane biosynthesis protein TonB [Pseudoclavibacter chungangensis]
MHPSDPCVLATTGPLDGSLALGLAGIGLVLVATALALLALRRNPERRGTRTAGLSLTVAVLVGALAFGAVSGAAPAQASEPDCTTTAPSAPPTTTGAPARDAPGTTTPGSTTPAPTMQTPEPTTPEPTTPAPTTQTPEPTTPEPTTPEPTTPEPTTPEPTTPEPTTPKPTTPEPTTPEPTTPEPTTPEPTTPEPTTPTPTCTPDPLGLEGLSPSVALTSGNRAGVSGIPAEVYERLVEAGAVFRLTDSTVTPTEVHWTEIVDGVEVDRGTQTVERERTYWSETFVVTEGLLVPTVPYDSRITSDAEFDARVAASGAAAGVVDPSAATSELVTGQPERTLTFSITVTDSCGAEQRVSYALPVD